MDGINPGLALYNCLVPGIFMLTDLGMTEGGNHVIRNGLEPGVR
jgi:hypothetical protein